MLHRLLEESPIVEDTLQSPSSLVDMLIYQVRSCVVLFYMREQPPLEFEIILDILFVVGLNKRCQSGLELFKVHVIFGNT